MAGRLESIYLEDFITYSRLELKCGQNLNVIIGPNGTGKSSIVCAMVLGLGGKPKSLGRATILSSFIRGGCTTAKIVIELYNPNGANFIIKRQITSENKSFWFLRGEPTTQNKIESLVSSLNIQVDNLCQFLPQDRVADFAKMNAQQLLENTERCAGPPGMIEQHEKLKELRSKYLECERHLGNMNNMLQIQEQKNNRLAVDVDNITEKKNLLETVKNLKQKRAWLRYETKRRKLLAAKDDKEKALRNLKRYENTYAPMEKNIAGMKTRIKAIEQSLKNQDQEMRERLSAVRDMQDRLESIEEKIKYNVQECDNKIQAEEERRNEVNNLKQQIDKLKNDLKSGNKESETAIREQLENIVPQMTEKTFRKNKLREAREQHQTQLEIVFQNIQATEREQQKVQDVARQRLQIIQRRNKDVYVATLWLRENKHRFRHQVFEPMILEINVTNPVNAKYVESIVSTRDLFAFTFEDKQDMNEFLRIVREEKNLRISALHSGSEQPLLSSFKPSIDISRLRKYGFHSYLLELITGPDLILRYLCRMYRLHNIPVGDASTYSYSEEVPECINCFFSENHSFFVSKSKYTGYKSLRTGELSTPYFLAISVNTQRLAELHRQMQILKEEKESRMKSMESIQTEIYRFDNELEVLRSRRKELTALLEKERTVQARLTAKQSQLAKLENTKVDPELEKKKCCQENQKLVLTMSQQTAQMVKLLKLYDQSLVENKILQHELGIMKEETVTKEIESRQLLEGYEQAKKLLLEVDQSINKYKNEATKLYEEAKVITGGLTPRDKKFDTIKQSFHFLPDTEEELDMEIQDSLAKANCLGESDDTVMTEYETQKSQIVKLKGSMETKQNECRRLKEEMDSIKEAWLSPSKDLITQISKKYGECFARLKCAGEVALATGENEDDYSQYGLKIKVKFRDGDQLQVLTHHLQSGGERAVATAIYMIALQELTRVPFCCVDEINQGMDIINERMIFELLVTTTRQSGTQYFLLTPKLIPALLYDESTAVHCVYNGSVNPPKKNFRHEQ